MFGITPLDLCSYIGLGAVGAIVVNLLLGMLIALRYSPTRLWPHRHINLFALHRWTAYLALVLILLHPAVLLFVRSPHFRLYDILFPVRSPLQPKLNSIGAIALYLILLVVVTSLLRLRMSRTVWRNLHFLVYPAAVLLLIHSIFTDPALKDGHPDLLDGGKVFVEIATVVMVGVTALRYRLRQRGFRPAATLAPKRVP
jgi:methionine sulfoxide reductase heme-binding subunit